MRRPTNVRIVSIQVGLPRSLGTEGAKSTGKGRWTTGFFKEPVAGPVHLGMRNIEGDGQADLNVHGGPDKAVLAYSADHYPAWRLELGLSPFPFGAFGENLTVSGASEENVCIGDVLAQGAARVRVSQPRTPCWKLARRWGRKDLPDRVVATGRSGWYFRVLEEGMIAPGPLTLLDRPCPEWTVSRVSQFLYANEGERDREAERALAACPCLADGLRLWFARRASGSVRS